MTEKTDFTPDYGAKENNAIIKVIGVGGGGGNAVKHMYSEGIIGVDFLVCNTDAGALRINPVPDKLVLGESGLGAGANPDVARKLALESKEKLISFIGKETKMLFITAGMGKGTGTGAAPVIAEIAKEMQILTIGVVTYPFRFEGANRVKLADQGIAELSKFVDSLIVVKNQNIMKYYHDDDLDTAYGYADDVLKNAVKCIAELITVNYDQNIDFNDIQTIMKNSGSAMLGLATASGENRVEKVVDDALSCPLLNEELISEVGNFLFFVSYGTSNKLKMSELETLTERFNEIKGNSNTSQVIWGRGIDDSLGDSIKLSVIITNYKTHSSSAKPTVTTVVSENKDDMEQPNGNTIVIETQLTDHVVDQDSNDFANPFDEAAKENDFSQNNVNIDSFLTNPIERDQNAQNDSTSSVFVFDGDDPVKSDTPEISVAPDFIQSQQPTAVRTPIIAAPMNPSAETSKISGGVSLSEAAAPQMVNKDYNSISFDDDDFFHNMVNTPAISRQQPVMKQQPATQAVAPEAQPMYEVDNDIFDFFKNIPD